MVPYVRDQAAQWFGSTVLLLGLLLGVGVHPAGALHTSREGSLPNGIFLQLHDLHPVVLAPGDLATVRVLLSNDGNEEVMVESFQLLLLHRHADIVLESFSPEVSDALPEIVAPRSRRWRTLTFSVASSDASSLIGRRRLAVAARLHSARGSHTLVSAAAEITITRLRMQNLTLSSTVLPDCHGATAFSFELEILNMTFEPVDHAELLYELRERDVLLASGRLRLGRIIAGERRHVRSLEPVEIPTSALVPGRRLELNIVLQPDALSERRLLVIGTGADLKVEDVVLTPPDRTRGDSILPGETAALGFTLINRGNQQGTSSALTVRVSAEADGRSLRVEPETIPLSNIALPPCGGRLRIGIAREPGDTRSDAPTPSVAIPEDVEEGDAIVRIAVDRVVEEAATDTDDEPSPVIFHIDLPNLRLLDVSVPQQVLSGQDVSVRFRVANVRDHPQDRAPVPSGVRVRAELIQSGRVLAQGEFRTRRPLGAGEFESPPGDFALRVPASAQEGPALVRVEVDPPTEERPRGDVRESNDADNVVEIPIRIVPPRPDFVVEAARVLAPGDPPALTIGAPTVLFFLVANRGEGAADPATHEISLALTITLGPFPFRLRAPLQTVETPRLGRGRFVPFLVTVRIPPIVQLPGLLLPIPVPPGPAELLITADSKKAVEETDEENNTVRIPVIVIPPP
jgi:hypothetical protein